MHQLSAADLANVTGGVSRVSTPSKPNEDTVKALSDAMEAVKALASQMTKPDTSAQMMQMLPMMMGGGGGPRK